MTDLADIIGSLERADRDAVDEGRRVVERGSVNIKRTSRRLIAGHPHSPHYGRTIGYDVDVQGDTVSSEIGPDKDQRQGALGNILEFGTKNNAPLPHLNPAADAETPRFARAVEDLGERLLR